MSASSNHPPEGPGFSDTPEDSESRWRVGRLLQREREAFDLDLRDVASALRIRYAYLLAIEEGRFSDLPGLTYAVGFVRTYADYLELDSDEIVRRFKDEVSGLDRTTQLEFPTPVSEAKVPSGAVILIAVLLLAVAYGGWLYLSKPGENLADLVPELPERFQSLVADSGEDGAADDDEAGIADGDMAAATVTENEAVPAAQPEPATETTAATAPAAEDQMAGDSEEPSAPDTTVSLSDNSENPEATVAADTSAEPIANEPVADEPAGVETNGVSAPREEAAAPETAPVSVAEVAEEAAEAVREIDSVPVAGDAGADDAEVAATGSIDQTGVDGSAPAIPETSEVAATPETTDEGGRIFGAANTEASVILHAEQDTWVQVRDGDGNLLLTRILREGDVYRVPAGERLTMLVGNAGGLRAEVNGEMLGALGAENQVRRGVPLAAQDLLDWYRSQR